MTTTPQLPRRIEAEDLRPGDVFEYDRYNKYARPQTQVRRDVVRIVESTGEWKISGSRHFADGRVESSGTFLHTADGETHHGYVNLKPKQVVVLIEQRDPATVKRGDRP